MLIVYYIFKDKVNIIDTIIILISFIFTIVDIAVASNAAFRIVRIRGVFRLFKVGTIIKQIDDTKDSRKSASKYVSYNDYKSPLERTIEILSNLKDSIDDQQSVRDIDFCLKNISNGKLYELEMNEPEALGIGNNRRSRRGGILQMEENLWIRSCSNASSQKKLSRMSSMIVFMNRKSSALQARINISDKARELFEVVDSLDFNIFEFKEAMKDSELVALSSMLMEKHNIFKILKINKSKFINFVNTIQSGYKKVPYHNKTHGTDVAQTLYFFLIKGEWMSKGSMETLDLLSMIIGGCWHDFEHPGLNAAFLMKTNDRLALRYNDVSVLENHHVAATYEVLSKTENNIYERFKDDEKKEVRKMMIEMILATDMSKHFADLGKFKSRIVAENFDPKHLDKQLWMNMGMHVADISNPSKKWDISLKWTEWLYEEFFAQGDKERELGMQISDLMDRTTIII